MYLKDAGGSLDVVATTTTALQSGVWYSVAIHFKHNSITNKTTAYVYVNETLECSATVTNSSSYTSVQRFEFGNVGHTGVAEPGTWIDSITVWDDPSTDPFKKPYYIFGLSPRKDGKLLTSVTPSTGTDVWAVLSDSLSTTYAENTSSTTLFTLPCEPISGAYETDFGNRDIVGISNCSSVVQGNNAAGDVTRINIFYNISAYTTGQDNTPWNGNCTGGWMMRHNIATVNPWRARENSVNGTNYSELWLRTDLDSNMFGTRVTSQTASTGANAFKVSEQVAEVVWHGMRSDHTATSRGPVEQPEAYLIWPGAETNQVDAVDQTFPPSQGGPFADVAYPEMRNNGSMLVFQHGNWDVQNSMYDQPQEVEYAVCKGGSLDHLAEYVWRVKEDNGGLYGRSYRGFMGIPYIWGHHNPFSASGVEDDWTIGGNADGTSAESSKNRDLMCVGYSSLHSKLIYTRWKNNKLLLRSRSTISMEWMEDEDDRIWSQFNLKSRGDSGSTTFPQNRRSISNWSVQPSIIELPDGTIQLYYFYSDFQDSPQYGGDDFMIFQSDDGGENWSLINEQIMRQTFGLSQDIRHAEVASSGDWIRLDFYTANIRLNNLPAPTGTSTAGRQTLVSSDRGATWKALYSAAPTIADDGYKPALIKPREGSGSDGGVSSFWWSPNLYHTAAIAGIGDDAGTFIRSHLVDTSGSGSGVYYTQIERASRDEKWSVFSEPTVLSGGLPQSVANPIQLQCTSGGGFVYAYAYSTEFGANYPNLMELNSKAFYQIPHSSIDDYRWYSTSLERWQGTWGTYGAFGSRGSEGEYGQAPAHMRSCWAGDRIVRFYRTVRVEGRYNSAASVYETGMTTDALSTAMVSDFIGGWTQLPLRGPEAFNPLFREHSALVRWTSGMGYWGDNASSEQDLIETSPATGTNDFVWNNTQMCVDHTVNGGSGGSNKATAYTNMSVGGLSNYIMDHGVAGIVTRRHPTESPTAGVAHNQPASFAATPPAWGMRVRSGSTQFGTWYGGVTQFCDIYLSLSKDGHWAIWDDVAAETLYTSDMLGAQFSSTYFFEFRLAFANSDQLLKTSTTMSDNKWWVRLLYKIQERDTSFASTPLLTITTTGTPSWGQNEIVGFGSFDPDSSTDGKFQYREFFTQNRHSCNLVELDKDDPTTYRGAPTNSADYAVGMNGYKARWGGASAFRGDTFRGGVSYHYGVRNLTTPSPSQVWQTQNEATEGVIRFHADILSSAIPEEQYDVYYNHNSIAIMNCNVRLPKVSYAATTSFAGAVDYTIDLTKYYATVTGVTGIGQYFTVTDTDAAKWEDSELVEMYADIVYNDGTQQSYKVRRNTGNRVYLSGLTQALNNNMSVMDTVAFFDGNGATVFGGDQGISYKAMKITVPTANTVEGFLKLGGYVAGMTMPFTVPLEWDFTDTQAPNIQMYQSDRGTKSAYRQGPPRRTLQGQVVGDVNRWREGFRGVMSRIADYAMRPIVLVTDHNRPNNNMLYCRYNGPTTNDNTAWKYNAETAQWERVGNLGVEFVEEV